MKTSAQRTVPAFLLALGLLLTLSLLLSLPMAAVDRSQDELPAGLAKPYREWLERVWMLLTEEELTYFLGLEENYRRDAFIEAFWAERDPLADTPHFNELRVHYEERVVEALDRWKTLEDARAQTWIRHGAPHNRCTHRTREYEVWIYYEGPEGKKIVNTDDLYPVLLYARVQGRPYEKWDRLFSFYPVPRRRPVHDVPIYELCSDASAAAAMRSIAVDLREPPEPDTLATLEIVEPSKEWVAAFASTTTELPAGAATFPVDLTVDFPGRHQQRTVVQGVLEIRPEDAAPLELAAAGAVRQFLVLGEVVRGDELFETFRYRFELPAAPASGAPLGLVFQRYLRPGDFRLVLKVEDLYGRRFARVDRRLVVPDAQRTAPSERLLSTLERSELYRALSEANAATARGEHSLRLLSPPGVVHTGYVRFQTITVGDFDRVDFLVDDQVILSKRAAPYSVELDLGEIPVAHRLRVEGFDAAGERLAADELQLNPGGQSFRVRLSEPRSGRHYDHSVRAAVQVAVPDGEELERVELYLDERRVATLYQPPFVQPIVLDGPGLAYVRAVAYLTDGNANEDLVFINADGPVDEINVQFVELYATVHDRSGRFVEGLTAEDFKVLEDGARQRARRFERVEDLPLHTALLIDVSASMEDSLEKVGEAALTFVREVITRRDRATLIAFDDEPHVAVRFTSDVAALERELEALRATGSTALYDSLMFALHYFHGVKGQRALLLLSDGQDESSHFSFDAVLEFARRAGVTIYSIGLKESNLPKPARRVLRDVADETGGRSYFIDDLAELPAIYAAIQAELRSQYLFAYQSTSDKDDAEFRRVEVVVEVDGKKAEVRTMSGYYP